MSLQKPRKQYGWVDPTYFDEPRPGVDIHRTIHPDPRVNLDNDTILDLPVVILDMTEWEYRNNAFVPRSPTSRPDKPSATGTSGRSPRGRGRTKR